MRVVVDIDDPVLFSSKFIPPSYTGEPAKRS
jgi:acid phosphatase class B